VKVKIAEFKCIFFYYLKGTFTVPSLTLNSTFVHHGYIQRDLHFYAVSTHTRIQRSKELKMPPSPRTHIIHFTPNFHVQTFTFVCAHTSQTGGRRRCTQINIHAHVSAVHFFCGWVGRAGDRVMAAITTNAKCHRCASTSECVRVQFAC
jgi:hypothetical protein